MRLGADVVHKGNAKVHVSGHASAGELLYCYNIVKPANVLPVHGEWRHMHANAQLAIRSGVPEGNVVLAEDGVVVDLVDGQASVVGVVECGYVYVDGSSVAAPTRRCSRTAVSCATRASSRASSCSTPPPARSRAARRSRRAASSRTRRSSSR